RRSSFSSISINAWRFLENTLKESLAFLPLVVSFRTRAGSTTPIFPSNLAPPATQPETARNATHPTPTQNTCRMTASIWIIPLLLTRGDKFVLLKYRLKYRPDRKLKDPFAFVWVGIQINPVRSAEGAKG